MDFSTLILFFVYIVNIFLLVFMVFHKDSQRSWPFFWMILLLAIWQSTELLNITWLIYQDKNILLFGVQAGLLPALYLAPAFVRLVFSLFGKWDHMSGWAKFWWWIPAIVMSFFVFGKYNVAELVVNDGRFFYVAGPIYWFFATYFVLLMSYGLYVLAKNRKNAGAIVRRQIDYIFLGTALAALGGLLFNILFPILGIHNLYYLGVNSTIFFSVILTYALFRYRFFDLKIAFYQAMINFFKLFVVFLFYYIFYIIFYDLVKIDFSRIENIIVLLLVVGFSAPLIFNLSSKMAFNLFVNPNDDFHKSIDKIAGILRSSRDLDILLSRLSREINKVIDYKEMFIYLSKKKDLNAFYQVFPVGERLVNKNDSHIIQYLARKKRIFNLAEVDYFFSDKMLIKEMQETSIDLAMPIFYNKQLLGVVMIDNDDKLFSIQELQFLKELNKYLDISVGSLLLHQQDLAKK